MFRSPVQEIFTASSEFNDESAGKKRALKQAGQRNWVSLPQAIVWQTVRGTVITGGGRDVLEQGGRKRLRAGGGRVDFRRRRVSTEKGRKRTLKFALEKLGGLDV